MSRYLVTGGAGFIGSNIVKELTNRDEEVTVLDNFSTGKRKNIAGLGNRVRVVEGDIRDFKVVSQAMQGVDFCIHQAALPSVLRSVEDPVATTEVNIRGTLNVLMAAREACIKRLIFASSSSVYGDSPTLPKREDMLPNPLSPYALTKLVGEHYCRLFTESFSLPAVALRYFNVFGPNQDPQSEYAAVVPHFITAFLKQKKPIIYGDGEQSRDFTYVDNVIQANLKACVAEGAAGKVFNVACGQRVTVNQLFHCLRKTFGAELQPEYAEPRPGDVRHSMAAVKQAEMILDYKPSIKFMDGIRKAVAWYRDSS